MCQISLVFLVVALVDIVVCYFLWSNNDAGV